MTENTNKDDALELVAANRESFGKADGMRQASQFLLERSLSAFREGADDAYAAKLRDLSKGMNVTAEEMFQQWRQRNKVDEDRAIELLTEGGE